jgi:hypothetical protein
MPDQPDDPIHYDMKIPPEPQDAPLNKQEQQKDSDEEAGESKNDNKSDRDNPAHSDGR